MKTSEQLKQAKLLIATPDKWTQGKFVDQGKICASEAIARTTEGRANHHSGDYMSCEAYKILEEAMGIKTSFAVSNFNDSHTHEEVLAAFDRAIEIAQSRE